MDKLTVADLTSGFKAIKDNAALIKSASEIKDIDKWAFWQYLNKDVTSHRDEQNALKAWGGSIAAQMASFFGQSLSPGSLGALQMISTTLATVATGFALKPAARNRWLKWIKGNDYKNFMSKVAIIDIYYGNAKAGQPSNTLDIKMEDLIRDPVGALQKAADSKGIPPAKMAGYEKRISNQTAKDIEEFYNKLEKVDKAISAVNWTAGGAIGGYFVAPGIYDITHGRNPGGTIRDETKRATPPKIKPKPKGYKYPRQL